ncbi:hypothetical protein SY83_06815 [Paenibacillus swuensis]|uniref:DUF2232 domain-containing protein n=1 Tax=Paenibacillus swuensis TaxID=1178515 RepID=A0A172TGL6_9BACL|nr:DUF2232 domain-containing protein [Paenibacillus swuensis]ANE46044.1 hypothetical protein SY83_06815 [Paenibacillus swuensis]
MNNRWKPYLWAFIYVALLLLMLTPFNFVAMSLLLVPLLSLFVLLDVKRFAVVLIALCGIPFLLLQSVGLFTLILTLFFAIPAVVMGTLYKKEKSAMMVLTSGIITVLGVMVAGFAISGLLGFNIGQSVSGLVEETMKALPSVYDTVMPEGYAQDLAGFIIQLIPLYMILGSFYFVSIGHTVTRRLLLRQGIVLPKLPPFRNWMLPKALVFYYLIAMVLNIFISPDDESTLSVVLVNMIPLLNIAFSIQAFSFLCFVADLKKWNKFWLVLGLAAVLFFPPLSLLGVFDTAFPIRQRLKN